MSIISHWKRRALVAEDLLARLRKEFDVFKAAKNVVENKPKVDGKKATAKKPSKSKGKNA